MRAIVVGGGIGGLATARGLTLCGWDVVVLERLPRLETAGAGLSLWPNALRALDWLGVGSRVRAAGTPITGGGLRTAEGAWLSRVTVAGPIVVHRADLHEILAEGLCVRTGVNVTDVRTLEADLIVGADGIGSAVRAQYAPQVRIRDSTNVSWRAVVPPDPSITSGGETMGPGGHRFGYAPMGERGIYWYAVAPGPLRTTSRTEQLTELADRFAAWHDPIPRLLAATDPNTLLHYPLHDLHPVAPMRFGDRVALVGDAAHAMTPYLGQGACQALEDAVTLAAVVSQPASPTRRPLPTEAPVSPPIAETRTSPSAPTAHQTPPIAETRTSPSAPTAHLTPPIAETRTSPSAPTAHQTPPIAETRTAPSAPTAHQTPPIAETDTSPPASAAHQTPPIAETHTSPSASAVHLTPSAAETPISPTFVSVSRTDTNVRVGRSVAEALVEYDRIRRPRVAMVVRRSRLAGRMSGALARVVLRVLPARVLVRGAEKVSAWEPPTREAGRC
ncbi:FAD-dependent monooxygenase [Dactylosporangium sp. McL0621]|uniref:FAD-dependent monooxygenase n=1 Tax=Dactylosporangium sp. McL0621 TaxID=3415678 RepID=UPI003CF732C0